MSIMKFPPLFEKVIRSLQRLQGIGRKSAERFAFDILSHWGKEKILDFAHELREMAENLIVCEQCNTPYIKADNTNDCFICTRERKNVGVMAIVASLKDLFSLEATGQFQGTYFVLGSLLSPLDDRGISDQTIDLLVSRIQHEAVQEIILALDHSPEGEATTLYLRQKIRDCEQYLFSDGRQLRLTMLATGVPVGSSFEFIDRSTLGRALTHRVHVK